MVVTLSKEEINLLPLQSFEGKVHVASNKEEGEKICSFIEGETVLGFDTETKPSFKKGESHPLALIQLASDSTACIFQVSKTKMPVKLKKILQDEQIIKVAQEPIHDLNKLYDEHRVNGKGFVDLVRIAEKLECSPRSLKALCAIFLGFRISKSVQTSNWARKDLTEKQILYAATDAWVSRQVFMEMHAKQLISKPWEFIKWARKKSVPKA